MNGRIEAEKVVFAKLFSEDFWFVIPEYQRSYVWQKDNICELLEDMKYAFDTKPDNDYFLGSIVLKRTEQENYKEYDILDGQQRLTTFLMLMAVCRDLSSEEITKTTAQEAIVQKENKIKKIPQRTRLTYKIRENVNEFFEDILVNPGALLDEERISSYISQGSISVSNMAAGLLTLKHEIEKVEELDEFITFIFNNCLFIYVATDSTQDAFRMFTILNDRGIPLSASDIIKSQNIGALNNDKDISKYAMLWEEIESARGQDFDRFLQFIRTVLVMEKARANIVDEFEEKIYNAKPPKLEKGKATFELIKKYDDIYNMVIDLDDDALSNKFKNLITVMKYGFRSEDWIPPLLCYYEKFGNNKLYDFLRLLEYKYSTEWVCGVTPTARLESMNSINKIISRCRTADEVLKSDILLDIYVDEFREHIEGEVYKKPYIKYLLLKLEYLRNDQSAHTTSYNFISVEHVLPQKPRENSRWFVDFTEEEHVFWINRLANLVLINRRKNSALGNLDFADKKDKYLNGRMDSFMASKAFVNEEKEWTPEILRRRQEKLTQLLIDNPYID